MGRSKFISAVHIDKFFLSHGVKFLEDLTHDHFEKAWQNYRRSDPPTAGAIRQLQKFLDQDRSLVPCAPRPKTITVSKVRKNAFSLDKTNQGNTIANGIDNSFQSNNAARQA